MTTDQNRHTNFCDEEHSSWYRQIIGILCWAIKLGQFDILLEVSLLSQYQANPRNEHLEALYLIINYLHIIKMKCIVFDPWEIEMGESVFNSGADWKEFYGDVKKEDPLNMPPPLGAPVSITCFVNSDHAGNKVTRCLHTGIIIFISNALIQVFSKTEHLWIQYVWLQTCCHAHCTRHGLHIAHQIEMSWYSLTGTIKFSWGQ